MSDLRRLLLLPLMALLLVAAACTAEQPRGPATASAPTETMTRSQLVRTPGESPCPRRARSPQAVIEKARSRVEGPSAWLCRYRHVRPVAGGLRLQGSALLAPTTAERLYDAFVHRSRAMVDCAGDLRHPLYAVVDRDPQGRPRIVTVDLAFCATIEAEVGGAEAYGLATDAHRRLLEEAWSAR